MSPYEMNEYREEFDKACRTFGWEQKTVEMQHERDERCSWSESVWLYQNERLFSEDNLEEGLVKEIIRIADLIRGLVP